MTFKSRNLCINKGKKKIERHKKKKGFTLIELTVVLAIMALMITVVAPNFKGVKDNATSKIDKQNCITIQRAVEMLLSDDSIKSNGVITIDPPDNGELLSSHITSTTADLSSNAKSELANILYDLKKPHNGNGQYTVTINNGRVSEVKTGK